MSKDIPHPRILGRNPFRLAVSGTPPPYNPNERLCRHCGKLINGYNRGPYCYQCRIKKLLKKASR